MKSKILLLVLILMISLAYAAEKKVDDSMSLAQISAAIHIPVSKLIEYLELPHLVNIHLQLSKLERNDAELQKAITRYEDNENNFHLGIMLVGMFTVFISLLLVALIISQLRHIDKTKKVRSSHNLPSVLHPESITSEDNDIIAAITATLYLYELELEENDRLLLTWKRTPLSMWKAANYIPMNEIDPSRRK
ncbi:MAG: OadG family protein [Candidatus Cloacimonetes bacterium]|nr:OadG family protein [Candidatus Cloacimonadota bacterium]